MKQYLWNGLIPLGLCFLLTFGGLVPMAVAQSLPSRIDLVVVEGEGATIGIRQRAASDPAVRVEDVDHRPMSGVSVTFTLPLSGASGEFPNGSKTLTVVTDQGGLATARGLRANGAPGKLQIYVTASFRGLRARTLINMLVNVPPGAKPSADTQTAKSSGKWKWIVLGVVAAGGIGAGAYYLKTRNSSNSAITISAGSVVFGNPR
jgi:hypothetical protein